MTQSKTLKLADFYNLRQEINTIVSEELNMIFKLELTELFEEVAKVLAPVEKLKQELIDKYLKAEMEAGKKAEECTEFAQFETELGELLVQERSLNYIPIPRKYWDFKTTKYYPLLVGLRERNDTQGV